jgi:hypothetical protein
MPTMQHSVSCSSGGSSKAPGGQSARPPAKRRCARHSVRSPVAAMAVMYASRSARAAAESGCSAASAPNSVVQRASTISAAPCMQAAMVAGTHARHEASPRHVQSVC